LPVASSPLGLTAAQHSEARNATGIGTGRVTGRVGAGRVGTCYLPAADRTIEHCSGVVAGAISAGFASRQLRGPSSGGAVN